MTIGKTTACQTSHRFWEIAQFFLSDKKHKFHSRHEATPRLFSLFQRHCNLQTCWRRILTHLGVSAGHFPGRSSQPAFRIHTRSARNVTSHQVEECFELAKCALQHARYGLKIAGEAADGASPLQIVNMGFGLSGTDHKTSPDLSASPTKYLPRTSNCRFLSSGGVAMSVQ